jgi:hypothetical protein
MKLAKHWAPMGRNQPETQPPAMAGTQPPATAGTQPPQGSLWTYEANLGLRSVQCNAPSNFQPDLCDDATDNLIKLWRNELKWLN